ncbi:MAG: hypothetical protein PVSMB7_29550 [Chloroflexota bacterium]
MNNAPDEYAESVGSVVAARNAYEAACAAHGAESWAAEQAQAYLQREIEHRNQMRTQHDAGVRD